MQTDWVPARSGKPLRTALPQLARRTVRPACGPGRPACKENWTPASPSPRVLSGAPWALIESYARISSLFLYRDVDRCSCRGNIDRCGCRLAFLAPGQNRVMSGRDTFDCVVAIFVGHCEIGCRHNDNVS